MKILFYLLAAILLFTWITQFIIFHEGGLIHLLLLTSIIAVFFGLIQKRRAV